MEGLLSSVDLGGGVFDCREIYVVCWTGEIPLDSGGWLCVEEQSHPQGATLTRG